jgi:DNA topoisomerase I
MYLIDRFALRAGNEKGEDEADTVGCCSLRFEHIALEPPNKVTFDFLGKDSIRYLNEVEVDPQVFKNLKIFKRSPKTEGDMLFDRINTGTLNKHLGELMTGLSAKVFRTFNASFVFQDQLEKLTPKDGSVIDKFAAYTEANRQVAILCNHKRAIPKTHDIAIGKIEDQVRALKYQKWRLRNQMVQIDLKILKKQPDFLEYESDIDEEWIHQHQKDLVEKQREQIKKKFEKENEKRAKEDLKSLEESELQSRLEAADEQAREFAKENKSGTVEPTSTQSIEKCEKAIQKLDERIYTLRSQREMRESNKETALGTSKLNYIDPRMPPYS